MNHETAESDYLIDLKKWQASSHPILANSQPEELFEPKFAERYHLLHRGLFRRMTDLHGTLLVLRKLRDFPFDHIYGPLPEFWRLVIENFVSMACIRICALMTDSGPDTLTLPKFKNKIFKTQWIDPEKCKLYRETLRHHKPENAVEEIVINVRELRNNEIAHSLIDKQSTGVRFDELLRLFDATHALFGALSFGSGYVTLSGDFTPGTIGGKPTKTSLDDLLDSVLRDSDFVNEPERESDYWSDSRLYCDKEHLKIMNQCRRRIGLPEA